MMKKDNCSCEPTGILIFSCSGASNVGQIANEATKKLVDEGTGSMSCLAGIGGHISGFAEEAREAKKVVAIDGCAVHCVRKTLEHADCPVTLHVVVTDLGVKKKFDFHLDIKDIAKVLNTVKEKLRV
jgi:uncharacterized metal-binding protein